MLLSLTSSGWHESALSPELELIESRVASPVRELQGIMKMIRKSMTKRDHKVLPARRVHAKALTVFLS